MSRKWEQTAQRAKNKWSCEHTDTNIYVYVYETTNVLNVTYDDMNTYTY